MERYDFSEIVGLVPARLHSKGLPGKNRFSLNGKSLLSYALEPILKIGLRAALVSTDDPELYEAGLRLGGIEIGLRPSALASDTTLLVDVMRFERERLKERGIDPSHFIVPQLTSPGLTTDIATSLLQKCLETGSDVGFTYCRSPLLENNRLFRLDKDHQVQYLFKASSHKRRQDVEQSIFSRCGLVYVFRCEFLDDCGPEIYSGKCCAVEIPDRLSGTIDTESDFRKMQLTFEVD